MAVTRLEQLTGRTIVLDEVSDWIDGSPMDISKVDGVIYRSRYEDDVRTFYKTRDPLIELEAKRFDIHPDSGLIAKEKWDKFFNAVCNLKAVGVFESGVYTLPYNYQFEGGYRDIYLRGSETGKTVFTTKYDGHTMEIVRRVNLLNPMPIRNGFVRVDATDLRYYYESGVLSATQYRRVHSDWAAVKDASINDYIQIVDGVPSLATLEDVKAAGLLTELDPNGPDPGFDGIYVVAGGPGPSGGGYGHHELNQVNFNTNSVKVPYLLGTVLERIDGIWRRREFAHGIVTGGSIVINHIHWDDCCFYPFTPKGTDVSEANKKRVINLDNTSFNQCSRICGLDRWGLNMSGSGGWGDYRGLVPGRYNHYLNDGLYNYQLIKITNLKASYIHTSLFWEVPPAREIYLDNWHVHDCYTSLELWLYNPYGTGDDGYTNEPVATTIKNMVVERCRKYDPTTGGYHLFRSLHAGTYDNIRITESTGICFYAGGVNNKFSNCHVSLHVESYGEAVDSLTWSLPEVFHLKGLNFRNPNGNDSIVNCTVNSAYCTPIDQKLRPASLTVSNCEMTSNGYYDVVWSTTEKLDPTVLYRINDFENFKSLATEVNGDLEIRNYDEVNITSDGQAIYYDKRRGIWRRMYKTMTVNGAILDRSTESSGNHYQEVLFNNCILRGTYLVKILSSNYKTITVNGGVLKTDSDLIFASGTKFLELFTLNNVKWYRGLFTPPTLSTPNIKRYYINNCQIIYGIVYPPNILFTDECVMTNTRVDPDPDIAAVDMTIASSPATTIGGAILFRGTGENATLKIIGGSFDAKLSRYAAAEFDGVKNLYIDGLETKIVMPYPQGTLMTGGGGRRFCFVFSGDEALNHLEVRNLKVNSDDVPTVSLFLKTLTGELSINNLFLQNNKAYLGKGLTRLFYISVGTIVVDKISYGSLLDIYDDTTVVPAAEEVPAGKRIVTANTSVTVGYDVLLVDTSAGNVTVTLNSFALKHRSVKIKKISSDSNLLTVVPDTGTIEGHSNVIYQEQYTGGEFIFGNSNYFFL